MEPKKYPAIVKWSLVIGIVIVINMFFNYAISLIYSAPQYDQFCKQEQVIKAVTTKDACLAEGGQWDENFYGGPAEPNGYCNLQFTCSNDYNTVRMAYEKNVFIVLVSLGILLVAVSFILSFNWILSVSASMGGLLSIIIASIRYWSEAGNALRVGILFVALCVLIYFAVKKFKD
jgi:hypothetical protein